MTAKLPAFLFSEDKKDWQFFILTIDSCEINYG